MRTAESASPQTAPTRFVRTAVILELTQFKTVESLRGLVRRGVIPGPIALSRRSLLWDLPAVQAALDRLAAEGGGAL